MRPVGSGRQRVARTAPGGEAPAAPGPPPHALRSRRYSRPAEQTNLMWVKRFIHVHNVRHPADMVEPEINVFLRTSPARPVDCQRNSGLWPGTAGVSPASGPGLVRVARAGETPAVPGRRHPICPGAIGISRVRNPVRGQERPPGAPEGRRVGSLGRKPQGWCDHRSRPAPEGRQKQAARRDPECRPFGAGAWVGRSDPPGCRPGLRTIAPFGALHGEFS